MADTDESTWSEALLADLTDWSRDPFIWTLSFFVLTVGLGASVLLYVGGGSVSDTIRAFDRVGRCRGDHLARGGRRGHHDHWGTIFG